MRTLFIVVLMAGAAGAQSLSCIAQPVDTPALRDNGVTERIGDIKIVCTGGTPTAAGQPVPQFNLQVFTSPSVNITSRSLGGEVSEALLLADEPVEGSQALCGSATAPAVSGVCAITGTGNGQGVYSGTAGRPNAFVGRRVGSTSILFPGIPFDPPGAGPARVLRLTNFRVNASQLNNVRGGATALNIVISTSTAGLANGIQLPLGNPAPTVGIAQTPMDMALSYAEFRQCESQSYLGTGTPAPQLGVTFRERFPSAFRRRSAALPNDTSAAPTPTASANLNAPQLSETESGFYKIANTTNWTLSQLGLSVPADASKLGLADFGTRLQLRVSPVVPGIQIAAAAHARLVQISSTLVATGDVHMVSGTGAAGEGAYVSAGPTGTFPTAQVNSNTAVFVWEVITTNPSVTEQATIPIGISYTGNPANNSPTPGPAIASSYLAATSSTATASATEPIPRFTVDIQNTIRFLYQITDQCTCAPAAGPNRGGASSCSNATPPPPAPPPPPPPAPEPVCVPSAGPSRGGPPCTPTTPAPTPNPPPAPPPTTPPPAVCAPPGVPNRGGLPPCPQG